MEHINLGILAHVDAGKTTLTERLLYEAGVISELGSVDRGTTQTDALELERQRGITIKSAVATFAVGGATVNLIDTPGHHDFVAEVERALGVLDGAVLVVSSVEGVQPQTRSLARALERLGVPTLVFLSKVDRLGADDQRVEAQLTDRLGLRTERMGDVGAIGTAPATVTPRPAAASGLARDVAARRVVPLYPGSGVTGAGVPALMAGIASLLPAASGDPKAPASARVFKIERTRAGEKQVYVRVFDGELRLRDRVAAPGGEPRPITSIETFDGASRRRSQSAAAGEIARLGGLADARIGDVLGAPREDGAGVQFAPPPMEAVIQPRHGPDGPRLRAALTQLAEQDPLIDVRLDHSGAISVSLYGDVQRQVIAATLAVDYGLDVQFEDATPVCVERPAGTASSRELIRDRANPYSATVGLRVEPLAANDGVRVELDVESRFVPIFIYKTRQAFLDALTRHVERTLEVGNFGWRVTDCLVTLTECDYYIGDGVPPPGKGRTAAADFRGLVPVVLRQALASAGTRTCEPLVRARIETSSMRMSAALALATGLEGQVESVAESGEVATIEVVLTSANEQVLQRRLSGATGGDGSCESALVGYREVRGAPLVRGSRSA
jgi:ribosomal protection tetracycline resistance protein